MADESDSSSPGSRTTGGAENIAIGSASRAKADAYLEEQTRLARLQSQNLLEQNAFELSHLRWRRFNDQIKGALQIMIVLLGAVLVIAIATAMWNASQAEGLVVEAFAVPPSFAQAGMGGDIVADDLTNKVVTMREEVNSFSLSVAQRVRKENREDIKVEIPETGVSLAQAWRYLRAWLGHERHVTGNLRDLGDGHVVLTVALEGTPALTLDGPRGDLDKIEEQAAERVFAALDPSSYVLYLWAAGRLQDALAAAARATRLAVSPEDHASAYSLWAQVALATLGDPYLTISRNRIAISIDSKLLPPHRGLMRSAILLGHDEEALKLARTFAGFHREDQLPPLQGHGFDALLDEGREVATDQTGDFAKGYATPFDGFSWTERTLVHAEYAARLHDVKVSRTLLDQALASEAFRRAGRLAHYYADAAAGDWRAAIADIHAFEAEVRADKTVGIAYTTLRTRTASQPLLAVALAHAGDFDGAHAAIADTPLDCVPCVTALGEIEALEGNPRYAAKHFALADRLAPSIPYADEDWGEMLLHRGDYDGAIAKFEQAHEKGPHFADPLETWGEALIAKNRSDLALAKFEEANKYAPNWGRLHLKWGEALSYAQRRDDAMAQYRIASTLDLSAPDTAELTRDMR